MFSISPWQKLTKSVHLLRSDDDSAGVCVRVYRNTCEQYGVCASSKVIRSLGANSSTLDLGFYGLENKDVKPLACALLVSEADLRPKNGPRRHQTNYDGMSKTSALSFDFEFPSYQTLKYIQPNLSNRFSFRQL